MSASTDPLAAIEAAVVAGVDDPQAIVMAWHVIAAYRRPEDDDVCRYWQAGPPGQPSYVAAGLMVEAQAHINRTGEDDDS